MNFEFHPEAEIEFNKAIDYYTEIEEELGVVWPHEQDICPDTLYCSSL